MTTETPSTTTPAPTPARALAAVMGSSSLGKPAIPAKELRTLAQGSASMPRAAQCGDGVVQGDEECDDGNAASDDECTVCAVARSAVTASYRAPKSATTATRTIWTPARTAARSRSAVTDTARWEGCDDGNREGDGCDANCRSEACGNGQIDGDEACDDGNEVDTDACTSACQIARCGDNFVWEGREECDDGNESATDAASIRA